MAPKDKAEKITAAEAADVEMKDAGAEATKEEKDGGKAEESKAEEAKEPEAPKEPEKPQEREEDAPVDSRPKLSGVVGFNAEDTTLNAMLATHGKMLSSLTEGGLQCLLSGARANVGLQAGRYMFEVMIIEARGTSQQASQSQQRTGQVIRVGFAAAGPSLLMPDGGDSVCFDADGYLLHGKTKKKVSQRFTQCQVVSVMLNLDPGSPSAHTVSLFRDGVRVSEPQPLPEGLRGRPLFPAVTYRGVTLRVNFSGHPLRPLPFKCRMVQEAAAADCQLAPEAVPEGGRHEVLFPVALPDEGTFDWLDAFLAKQNKYTELSSRAVVEWATKSGLWRKSTSGKGSNDRPEMGFGIPQVDDLSIVQQLASIAPELPRSYIVAEVKGNLLAESRKAALARFAGPRFKRTALVVMGEPSDEYKEQVHAGILEEKKAKAVTEAKRKKAEAMRKKLAEARKQKKEVGKDADEAKEGEDAKMEDGEEEEEVKVELTEEEKQVLFRKKATPDLLPSELAKSFAQFTLPVEAEGFDSVQFAWQPAEKCQEYLRAWVLHRKVTQRVDDLQPSKWFKDKWAEWQKMYQDWKKKQTEWKKVLEQLQEWKKEGKKADEDKDKKDGEDRPTEMNPDELDVFTVENVSDIGSGEPLFANFEYEDWALLSLRFELHLLVFAFRRDIDDPERTSFHENHIIFYYNRYFKKTLDLKSFGVSSMSALVAMVKDAMILNEASSMLEPQLSEDVPTDNFVKLAEEQRRDRLRRLDAGDETAELKFARPVAPAAARSSGKGQWQQKVTPGLKPPQAVSWQKPAASSQPSVRPYSTPLLRGSVVQPGTQQGQKRPIMPVAKPKASSQPGLKTPARIAPAVIRPLTPGSRPPAVKPVQPPARVPSIQPLKQARTAYGAASRW